MLGYFPTIYKDELLYSAFARYSSIRGLSSSKAIVRELLGSTVKTMFELPSNISYFSNQVSHFKLGTPEKLIHNYTMYGYYTAFLSEDDSKEVMNNMITNGGKKVYAKVGLLATDVPLRNKPFVCEKCIEEMLEKAGEFYINRLHQLPGVFYCHIHKDQILRVVGFDVRAGNRHKFYFDNNLYKKDKMRELPLVLDLELNKRDKEFHDNVQRNSIYLFNYHQRPGIRCVKEALREKLKEKNGISVNGSINSNCLKERVDRRLSDSLAKLYGINKSNIDFAIDILRRNNRKTHPFKYLVLSEILEVNICDVLAFKPKSKMLLPCLNKLCKNYGLELIDDYSITADYKNREPVLTVRCQICGFKYSRKENGNPLKFGRVKEFGELWMNELKKIENDDSMSLRAKAKHMHCDPGTIKKYSY